MPKFYNPFDWYWIADDGRLFSSKAKRIVQQDDASYAAWHADGAQATPWPRDDAGAETNGALNTVLAPYGLAVSA